MARTRVGLGAPLLRLRSDEQLVSLFRGGNEDAFRVIHDRYRARIHAYARQMLSSASADAEDVVQEIFVRAYAGLRANRRDLALRAWLYRIAHNRCIDELRRPQAIAVESIDELGESTQADPHLRAEQREALRRLIADVQRLPEQQRSALLMRELGGMPYADLSDALDVSVPAVKSLLVRARVGLVQASEARDIDCAAIREDLVVAHDRGVRASGRARRHMRDCGPCRQFRREVHGVSRRFGLLLPALGPLGVAAKLLGLGALGGGGAAAGSSTGAAAGSTAAAAGSTGVAAGSGAAAAGGGVAAAGGAAVTSGGFTLAGTGAAVAGGGAAAAGGGAALAGGGALAAAGTGHVAAIIAATVVAAGSAIGIQQAATAPAHPGAHAVARTAVRAPSPAAARTRVTTVAAVPRATTGATAPPASVPAAGSSPTAATAPPATRTASRTAAGGGAGTTTRAPRAGFTAGTATGSAAAGAPGTGASSTTSTATTSSGTTTTTSTSIDPSGTTTSSQTPTTTAGTPVTGTPTSTLPTTTVASPGSGPGTATSTPTTPASTTPTSTSAATTTAHRRGTGGGSTLLPVLTVTRLHRIAVNGHREGARGGLTGTPVTTR